MTDVILRRSSAMDELPEFNIATFCINILSFLFSLYIVFNLLKVGRMKQAFNDYHYRLRFSVRVATFIMCILHIAYQGLLSVSGLTPYTEIFYEIVICFTMLIILLVLFLTVDRYIRVCMVLQQTWRYKLLYFVCYFNAPIVILLCLFHLLNSIWGFIYRDSLYGWIRGYVPNGIYLASIMNIVKPILEIIFVGSAITTEYILTFFMIRYSIRSSLTMDQPNNTAQTGATRFQKVNRRMLIVLKEKQNFILWIILWSGIIVSVDVFNIAFQLYFAREANGIALNELTVRYYHQLQILCVSWISVRVFCIFKLLDMFLTKVKEIKKEGKKAKQAHTETTELYKVEKSAGSYYPMDTSCTQGESSYNDMPASIHQQGVLNSMDFRETFSN